MWKIMALAGFSRETTIKKRLSFFSVCDDEGGHLRHKRHSIIHPPRISRMGFLVMEYPDDLFFQPLQQTNSQQEKNELKLSKPFPGNHIHPLDNENIRIQVQEKTSDPNLPGAVDKLDAIFVPERIMKKLDIQIPGFITAWRVCRIDIYFHWRNVSSVSALLS